MCPRFATHCAVQSLQCNLCHANCCNAKVQTVLSGYQARLQSVVTLCRLKLALCCSVNPVKDSTRQSTVECTVQCPVWRRRDSRLRCIEVSDFRLQTAVPTSSLQQSLHFQTFPPHPFTSSPILHQSCTNIHI